jgi:membrane-bound lytic murein transglycosylase D
MNFYQNHNILPQNPEFPIITDTIMVNDYLNFNQISEVLGLPLDEIRTLNPQYRRDIIPASKDKPYSLVLPQDEISEYLENESEIHDHRRDEFFPNNQIVNPQDYYAHTIPGEIRGKDKVVYTVKSGDNLGQIALWFRVQVSDLRYWNNIHKNLIRSGNKLTIYVPTGQGEYYQSFNRMSASEKQLSLKRKPVVGSEKLAGNSHPGARATNPDSKNTVTADNNEKSDKSASEIERDYIYYKVKSGDSIWSIAKKFPGVSNSDIMKLNNMDESHNLKVGQVLKIMPKA